MPGGDRVLTVTDIDDPTWQHREWIFERFGWALVAVLLVLAALGYFGSGPMSDTTAEADDGSLSIEYERFLRNVGTSTMTIDMGPEAVEGNTATLRISRDLLDGWRIENVSPAPSTESGDSEWLIYEFDVLADGPPEVKVLYRGDGFGTTAGAIQAGQGDPVDITQWIYP